MPKDLKKLLLYPILIYIIISLEVATIVLLGFDSNVWWVWAATTVFVTVLVFAFAETGVNCMYIGDSCLCVFRMDDCMVGGIPCYRTQRFVATTCAFRLIRIMGIRLEVAIRLCSFFRFSFKYPSGIYSNNYLCFCDCDYMESPSMEPE